MPVLREAFGEQDEADAGLQHEQAIVVGLYGTAEGDQRQQGGNHQGWILQAVPEQNQ
ncbi:hypothetical protein D3C72_2486180 [compost metagenome]